jgi:hypothetical protein
MPAIKGEQKKNPAVSPDLLRAPLSVSSVKFSSSNDALYSNVPKLPLFLSFAYFSCCFKQHLSNIYDQALYQLLGI